MNHLLFVHTTGQKTGGRNKLGKDEREQLLTESRKEGRDIRQQFKNRIKEIKLKRQEQLA